MYDDTNSTWSGGSVAIDELMRIASAHASGTSGLARQRALAAAGGAASAVPACLARMYASAAVSASRHAVPVAARDAMVDCVTPGAASSPPHAATVATSSSDAIRHRPRQTIAR